MIINKIKRNIKRIFFFDKVEPISEVFGFDRGKPIDRFYIEKFISENKNLIRGKVLEVEENLYSYKFSESKIESYILKFSELSKVESNFVFGDLTDKNTIPQNKFDAFICTQTLNFIFDVNKAVESIYSLLKPNGVALISVACLTQISRFDADRWGDYWRFTPQGIQKIFENVFGKDNVEIKIYGNSFAATHFLKGFSSDELPINKLNVLDEDYPIVVAIKVIKDE